MAIDFACTNVPSWAEDALEARKRAIESPHSSKWAARSGPWCRIISSALIDGSTDARNRYIMGMNNDSSFEGSYETKAISGVVNTFRPKPGVDSIKVEFKGTMGSTKGVTVNFKVWSLEDLEIIEKLYMVPGISVIVEWGWSVSAVGGVDVGPHSKFYSNDAVQIASSEDPYGWAMGRILSNRIVYKGDYDGVIGVITNFNYSLNEYMGFDCSFELCAPGELWLEQSVSNVSEKCTAVDPNAVRKQSNLEAKFHKFWFDFQSEEAIEARWKLDKKNYPSITSPFFVAQEWELPTSTYVKERRGSVWDVGLWQWTKDQIKDAGEAIGINQRWLVYISWNKFVYELNAGINQFILDAKGLPKNPKQHAVSLAMDLIPIAIMPKMYPLDPRIITFQPIGADYERGASRRDEYEGAFESFISSIADDVNKNSNRAFGPASSIPKTLELTKETLDDNVNAIKAIGTKIDIDNIQVSYDELSKELSLGTIGLLNNVYLNVEWLRGISQLTAGEAVTADDYLKKILDEVNKMGGGLWDLQFRYDEKYTSLIHIFDANYTSVESRSNLEPYKFTLKDDPYPLIRNLKLESKLVDGFKSMVLYGNSKDTGNYDTSHQAMAMYSNKITDGFKIKQDINPETGEGTQGHQNTCTTPDGKIVEQKIPEDPAADLDMAYCLVKDDIDDDKVAALVSAMQAYITFINSRKPVAAAKIISNKNILLPFNCSFDIDGFSGLGWGNCVSVDYLPSRYEKPGGNGKILFQITKVNHDITSADWITTVETIMRVTPDTTEAIEIKEKLESATAEAGQVLALENSPIGETQQTTTYAAESTGVGAYNQRVNAAIQLNDYYTISNNSVFYGPLSNPAGSVISINGNFASIRRPDGSSYMLKKDPSKPGNWLFSNELTGSSKGQKNPVKSAPINSKNARTDEQKAGYQSRLDDAQAKKDAFEKALFQQYGGTR